MPPPVLPPLGDEFKKKYFLTGSLRYKRSLLTSFQVFRPNSFGCASLSQSGHLS